MYMRVCLFVCVRASLQFKKIGAFFFVSRVLFRGIRIFRGILKIFNYFIPRFLTEPLKMFVGILVGKHYSIG
jgi:hypothetical protein